MKKKLTPDFIFDSVAVANPAATSMKLDKPYGTPAGVAMTLPVSEIDFFDRNPRKIHDPEEFERLKESIREVGVQQPVHVTTPPGGSRYMLAKGGNSRLLCLKELLDETGDERFSKIPCIYTEYTSADDILIAHLIENEQRADMVFWDKACAYAEMRDIFQEAAGEALGVRPLAQLFSNKGLTVHFTKLSVYLFATDHLSGLGNQCNGLSIAKSLELRKTYNELQTTLKEAGQADDAAFAFDAALYESFWDETLENWGITHADDAELDVPALQKRLQQAFADFFEIDAGDKGRLKTTPAAEAAAKPTSDPDAVKPKAEYAANSPAPASVTDDKASAASELQSDSVACPPVDPAGRTIISNRPPILPTSDAQPARVAESVQPPSREQVLSDIQQAAKNLLAYVRIESLLISDHKMPYGFMLDFPDFNKKGWSENEELSANALINSRHPYAATVFIYLWSTSGEKTLWDSPQLLHRYNPFTSHPQSIIAALYQDEQGRNDMEMYGIGMASYAESVTTLMFELVVGNETARKAYFDYVHHCAQLEQLGSDNWEMYQERV